VKSENPLGIRSTGGVSHHRHSSGSTREGGIDITGSTFGSTFAPAFPMSHHLNPSARRNALAILATNLEGRAPPRWWR
jgi:hypothetical protein